jgi:hypothetical protein
MTQLDLFAVPLQVAPTSKALVVVKPGWVALEVKTKVVPALLEITWQQWDELQRTVEQGKDAVQASS